MRSDIKAAFGQAAADADASLRVEAAERAREVAEQKRFESDYKAARDRVIIPALKEVRRELRRRDWDCDIWAKDWHVKFKVSRAGLFKLGEEPLIEIQVNHWCRYVAFSKITANGAEGEIVYRLAEITPDYVHNVALKFFQGLSQPRL
jgi:hypothetical protein